MVAVCQMCGFKVPWDWIGKSIMEAHLNKEHPKKETIVYDAIVEEVKEC